MTSECKYRFSFSFLRKWQQRSHLGTKTESNGKSKEVVAEKKKLTTGDCTNKKWWSCVCALNTHYCTLPWPAAEEFAKCLLFFPFNFDFDYTEHNRPVVALLTFCFTVWPCSMFTTTAKSATVHMSVSQRMLSNFPFFPASFLWRSSRGALVFDDRRRCFLNKRQ